jgi:hypothetical protein
MSTTVNDAWLDALVLELRLLDVSGADIGDAVASVQEHLADSNETATDAFGPARDYARSLNLPAVPGVRVDITRAIVSGLVSLMGFFAVVFAAPAALVGDNVDIRGSHVSLTVMALVLVLFAPRLLQVIARARVWKLVAGVLALLAVQAVVELTLRHVVLFELPGLPIALVGAVVLVGAALWATFRQSGDPDPVRAPLSEPVTETGWSRFVTVLPNWILVVAAAFFVAVDVLLLRS